MSLSLSFFGGGGVRLDVGVVKVHLLVFAKKILVESAETKCHENSGSEIDNR
jgi:hypothetical protein